MHHRLADKEVAPLPHLPRRCPRAEARRGLRRLPEKVLHDVCGALLAEAPGGVQGL